MLDTMPVNEVVSRRDLDRHFIAVHGLLYCGSGYMPGEFILLPKEGPFDGSVLPMSELCISRNAGILIHESNLHDKLGGSSAVGSFVYYEDAIVLGEIIHSPAPNNIVSICNLWLIIMQRWGSLSSDWNHHAMKIVIFPENRLPKLPWSGFQGEDDAHPRVEFIPQLFD